MTARAESEATGRPGGLRIIVVYKLLKAIVQAGVAAGLLMAMRVGLATDLTGPARAAADRTVHPFLSHAVRELTVLATPRHLYLVAAILGADAVVSAVEGWVLHRGYPWASWLVVGATGALLPFELVELIHRPRAIALAMLLANTAIVAYLVRHAVASKTAREKQAVRARV
jgi:uncharacterized membrane protein (DUF2068 family)